MAATEFSIIFTLGIISSLHCVQMCGPLVLSYSLPLGSQSTRKQLLAHLAYNSGRVITYALLGAVAGFSGAGIGLIGHLAGVENTAAIIGGTLMIVAGLLMLNLLSARKLQQLDPLRFASRLFRPIGSRLSSPAIASKFTLGLMLGFLPCGLVYAALLRAVATGSPLAGALTMFAFGLGTTSALLLIGMFSSALGVKLGCWGNRLAAVSVMLMGAFLLWRGLMPVIAAVATAAATTHQCH
jgi:hypothetical protein